MQLDGGTNYSPCASKVNHWPLHRWQRELVLFLPTTRCLTRTVRTIDLRYAENEVILALWRTCGGVLTAAHIVVVIDLRPSIPHIPRIPSK